MMCITAAAMRYGDVAILDCARGHREIPRPACSLVSHFGERLHPPLRLCGASST